MKKDSIGVNIWDDYYDDGYVPEGEIQETHLYVEEYDTLDDADRDRIAIMIFHHLKTLDLTGVQTSLDADYVYLTNLSHARREKLVEELNAANLRYEGRQISVYSES